MHEADQDVSRARCWEVRGTTDAGFLAQESVTMVSDRQYHMRSQFTSVLLALQALSRRKRPWEQQRRIATIGLASARKLAGVLLIGRPPFSPRTREGTT
jgi:type VI protein secretion system component VasK